MDEAGRNLVMKPAHAVNPKVKVSIKYPNWYDHFQDLGFNLETQPKYFDGVYTGTETRDRRLQQPAPAAVPRLLDLALLREPEAGRERRRLGRPRRPPQPRSLRRAALADAVREGARDHPVRHPPAVSAGEAGRRHRRARVPVRARRRLRLRAGRQHPRPPRHAAGRQDLQAVPLDGRGLPGELSRHGRHPDGHRSRVPGRRADDPADRGSEGRPRHRRRRSRGSCRPARTSSSRRAC